MKTLALTLAAIAASATCSFAQVDVTPVEVTPAAAVTVFEGSQDVTWENPLKIDASKFADAAEGAKLTVTLQNATDVIEFKDNSDTPVLLPGTRFGTNIAEQTETSIFFTDATAEVIKKNGLQIVGKEFTVTKVEYVNNVAVLPPYAVWYGFFWVENWNTLELGKASFTDVYDNQKYMVIGLSEENKGNTEYDLNVLTAWENADAIIANGSTGNIVKKDDRAIINLEGTDILTKLEKSDRLMIQGNPGAEKNPFNFTYVFLSNDENGDVSTVVESLAAPEVENVNVYSVSGVCLRSGVSEVNALEGLPHGLYIVNGKKVAL